MDYTYKMYAQSDQSNSLLNQVRQRFGFSGVDAYFIMRGDRPVVVQWEGQAPLEYQGATLEETAANHCAALNAAQAGSDPDPAQMERALNLLGVKTRDE